ncbi:MAG: hypothetical protein HY901_32575 [Deltaproteobacteria bacterium]|nr:hypothetical protein [Deltaproteobacteria bacterium]
MSSHASAIALYLSAAVGSLFLITLVVHRARQVRGALTLVLLNLSLVLWDLGEAMIRLSRADDSWRFFTSLVAFAWAVLDRRGQGEEA